MNGNFLPAKLSTAPSDFCESFQNFHSDVKDVEHPVNNTDPNDRLVSVDRFLVSSDQNALEGLLSVEGARSAVDSMTSRGSYVDKFSFLDMITSSSGSSDVYSSTPPSSFHHHHQNHSGVLLATERTLPPGGISVRSLSVQDFTAYDRNAPSIASVNHLSYLNSLNHAEFLDHLRRTTSNATLRNYSTNGSCESSSAQGLLSSSSTLISSTLSSPLLPSIKTTFSSDRSVPSSQDLAQVLANMECVKDERGSNGVVGVHSSDGVLVTTSVGGSHAGGKRSGGGRIFECTECVKVFTNASYLSQHMRIHRGVKPYRCETCDRRFTQLCHLQQHIRTHTGEKPYCCTYSGCSKSFSQLSNLQSHQRSHAGLDQPFRCNSCFRCFADEASLSEHIPRHNRTKHLKTKICPRCGKSYAHDSYLARHMLKHAAVGSGGDGERGGTRRGSGGAVRKNLGAGKNGQSLEEGKILGNDDDEMSGKGLGQNKGGGYTTFGVQLIGLKPEVFEKTEEKFNVLRNSAEGLRFSMSVPPEGFLQQLVMGGEIQSLPVLPPGLLQSKMENIREIPHNFSNTDCVKVLHAGNGVDVMPSPSGLRLPVPYRVTDSGIRFIAPSSLLLNPQEFSLPPISSKPPADISLTFRQQMFNQYEPITSLGSILEPTNQVGLEQSSFSVQGPIRNMHFSTDVRVNEESNLLLLAPAAAVIGSALPRWSLSEEPHPTMLHPQGGGGLQGGGLQGSLLPPDVVMSTMDHQSSAQITFNQSSSA